MIYQVFKPIIKMALFFFFKKVVVIGKSNIPDKGPLIIVANHPNTVLDPLIIASITKQRIGFIANAGIFKNKLVAKILNYLHIIPIYRKKDVALGEKPNNENTFIRCHEYLEKGRTFLIFPEGSSYYELKLREIKTGTARIALSYEEIRNFEGDLQILPIALDYSDAIQFRSMISVTVNPPIKVKAFKKSYHDNKFERVSELTEAIRKELAKNIPHTSDKTQEEFLIKIHKFYGAYFNQKADLYVNTKESLQTRNIVSKMLVQIEHQDSELYTKTQNNIFSFFDKLNEVKLSLGFFSEMFLKKNKLIVIFSYALQLILLVPFYIFGLLINYIPYILPYKIFTSLKIDIEYKTSVQMISGVILFPLFYAVEIWLFRRFISDKLWVSMLLPFVFMLTGYIAMYFWIELNRASKVVKFYFFTNEEKKFEILKLRDEILDVMEVVEKKNSFKIDILLQQ